MLSDILGIIGVIIGVVGLGYALYADRERAKVERFIRAAGWDLYNKTSNQNAHVQRAAELLISSNPSIPEALAQINKADAFGQYLTRDTVKLIHHVEPKFDEEIVGRWVESERVFASHKELFMVLTPSSNTKI